MKRFLFLAAGLCCTIIWGMVCFVMAVQSIYGPKTDETGGVWASVGGFLVLTAFFGLPGILLLLWSRELKEDAIQEARRKNRQCIHCGYDLRGAPGRCPECGRGRK